MQCNALGNGPPPSRPQQRRSPGLRDFAETRKGSRHGSDVGGRPSGASAAHHPRRKTQAETAGPGGALELSLAQPLPCSHPLMDEQPALNSPASSRSCYTPGSGRAGPRWGRQARFSGHGCSCRRRPLGGGMQRGQGKLRPRAEGPLPALRLPGKLYLQLGSIQGDLRGGGQRNPLFGRQEREDKALDELRLPAWEFH